MALPPLRIAVLHYQAKGDPPDAVMEQVCATLQQLGHTPVPVRVDEHRERLLSIKRGELPWDEVNGWRLSLHREFDAAYASTSLPDRPDYEWANDYVVRARRSVVR